MVCNELEETQTSIMANIAERKAALHSESLEAVESLDGGIADEVAELRSLIESQLEQV